MTQNYQLTQLLQAVAKHLTSQEVIIETDFRPAVGVRSEIDGVAYKNLAGQPVIRLQAGHEEHAQLKTFLHECAHIFLHFKDMPRLAAEDPELDGPVIPQEALTSVKAYLTYSEAAQKVNDPREQAADMLAEIWYKDACSRLTSWQRGNVDNIFQNLLTYQYKD